MEALEAKKCHKEMVTFCTYKLRTFLGFDEVGDLAQQILLAPDAETGEIIRVRGLITC